MNKQALRGVGGVGVGAVFSAVAVALVWLPAACTSSGNPGGGGDDGGSSSGASSSGTSSGTSSSSGSSSGGTSSSSSSGSSSGTAGGDVDLTSGTTGLSIRALTLVGSNLYWIDSQGTSTAAIKSVPTTGGTVTTVLADPTLDQNMTTDGTLLYFTWTSPTADGGEDGILLASELDSVKVDGTGRTSLVTGFSTQTAGHQDPASELFLAGGNFYFVAASSYGNPQLESAPLAGSSSPVVVVAYPTLGQVLDLAWADSTGVYFTLQTLTPGSINFSYIPLTASPAPVTLYSGGGIGSYYPVAGQVTVVGSTVYFPVGAAETTGGDSVTFMSATVPATGLATTLGSTITGTEAEGMIGDAQDMYVFADGKGAGLYALNLTTGTPTNLELDPANGDVDGEIRALDSKNLYFGTTASLWAHAR